MELKMIIAENSLGNNWLCHIPGTSQAYYYPTKKAATIFSNKVNNAFKDGVYRLENNKLVKN
jgi:hypothetical protein